MKKTLTIMAILMVAMLAFGGTYAYFTASATATTKDVTTGTIKVNAGSITTIEAMAVSGTDILKGDANKVTVALNETTNVNTWVFAIFSVELKDKDGNAFAEGATTRITAKGDDNVFSEADLAPASVKEGSYILDFGVDTGNEASGKWVEVATGVYGFKVTYTATPTPSLTPIPDVCNSIIFYGKTNSAFDTETQEYSGGILMGAKINVSIETKAIQAQSGDQPSVEFATALEAYNAMMGIAG